MRMKKIFLPLIAFCIFFLSFPQQRADGGCGGKCNSIDPNNPNISSNGERIFLTGMSKENGGMVKVKFGLDLPEEYFQGGAGHKKKIESGTMACLRCHNFYGTGGLPFEYQGRTVKSANLVDIGSMHFTPDELKRALAKGIGMDKRNLAPFMPRFKLSDKQLKDVESFIKELPKRLNVLKAEQEKEKKQI